MSTLDKVKELRAEANEESQNEKIWEALEVIARNTDNASRNAVRDVGQSLREALA